MRHCIDVIDAEHHAFQPAIDKLVLDLMQTYNAVDQTDKSIIYNTYQCYLKDVGKRLRTDLVRARRFPFHFGVKLVRGAYLQSEQELSAETRSPSPIHDTIDDTHGCYNDNMEFLL